jgi:hypothetical protein
MALKAKIAKLDDVIEAHRAFYKADGDAFALDIEGADDVGALKRAKDHEKEQRRIAEKNANERAERIAELEKLIAEAADGSGKKKGDAEQLEAAYKAKLAKLEADLKGQLGERDGELSRLYVDDVANRIAAEISTAPAVILPHIKARLRFERVEGKSVTRVLDADGQVSALTPAELGKEFAGNAAFAGVIIASKAAGGGASGAGAKGGAHSAKTLDLSKASPKEIAANLKASGKISG